jgi:hypothetical protein
MDERTGTVRLVESGGAGRTLATTVSRSEVEQALRSAEEPVDLLVDVERATPDDGRETSRLTLGWERRELERLLETTDGSEISLAFDDDELSALLDEEVEAHGMRRGLAVLTVAAGMAAAGAGSAFAMPEADGSGSVSGTTQPATTQVKASDSSSGLSSGETAGIAAAGTILALSAAGFAVRSRRGPHAAT